MTIRVLHLCLISKGVSSNGQARANARLRKGISVSLTRRECLYSPASRLLAGVTLVVRKDSTMGYDIVTVETDAAVAEQFAREHGYEYLFDKETGKWCGGEEVYFRVNIWGMGMLANCMTVLLSDCKVNADTINTLMTKLSYNQGDHLDTELITTILDAIDSKYGETDTWVHPFTLAATLETWSEKYDGVPSEENVREKADWVKKTLVEWIAYLRIAKTMGGCLVW